MTRSDAERRPPEGAAHEQAGDLSDSVPPSSDTDAEARHAVEHAEEIRAIVRWTGCPSGCPPHIHLPPCQLAAPLVISPGAQGRCPTGWDCRHRMVSSDPNDRDALTRPCACTAAVHGTAS